MITFDSLSFGYGDDLTFNDLYLSWQEGCITGLVGPNGSGKSTCLKLAAGLLIAQQGEITIDGVSLHDLKGRSLAQQVSYLPQNRPVPMITVRSLVSHGRFPHVGLGRRLTSKDEEAVDRALALTGLEALAHRDLRTLSGGQQQKAYLALMMAQDAPHVLLDEPTTYLDIRHQLELMTLLKTFKAAGKCVVVVLHDLNQAMALCDQVQVLSRGQLLYTGSPAHMPTSGAIEAAFGVRPIPHKGFEFELMA